MLEGRGNAALRERLFKEFPGLLEVEFHTPESEATPPVVPMPEELDWADTYASYIRDTYASEPDEALLSAFRQAYEEVHAAEEAA